MNGVRHEPVWPAGLAVLGVLVLTLTLPDRFTMGPGWLVPSLEGALLVPLVLTKPHRTMTQSRLRRRLSLLLTALLSTANAVTLSLLVQGVLNDEAGLDGRRLIHSAIVIWATNVVVFALWFWELDRGGPAARAHQIPERPPDFLYPQMSAPEPAGGAWQPRFVDYFYVSFTNSAAFSPTDTMPLTAPAKILMLIQASLSIVTVVVVGARAVNILA